ncbi:MAG: hypothetical protein AB1423_14455 [Pseudomonadota bacterium]
MIGQQVYIFQKNNLVPDAAITADISPSARPPLVYPVTKKGNGDIRMYGNFTGPVDAQYELKIKDTALEQPIVSAPVFRGAGTGKISGISVSGLQAQDIQVLCISTGTDTMHATIEIEGQLFRAKGEGSQGNAIYLLIDDSPLVFTETDFSLIKSLKVGDTALAGQEWDWETKVIQGDKVPSDARRVAFGLDRVNIYLQYKKFEDGAWKYYFIMPVRQEVKSGAKVYFVTGGRKVTVTDGAASETYTGIITIADFWQKVKDSSSLIEPVNSSIDTSRTVTSPAVREFSTKTDAHFLSPYKSEQSSEHAGKLESIQVNNTHTKTELIEIRCVDNTYLGQEIWNVKGSSSGNLGQARTGQLAQFAPVAFSIPQAFPENWNGPREDWSYEVQYASRPAEVMPPPICFAMRLGINSQAQTLTLTYKRKPVQCDCPSSSFSEQCLGLTEEGGEIGMASYTVPDLNFYTEAAFEYLIESWGNASDQEEQRERGGDTYSKYKIAHNITNALQPYKQKFKDLASRLMSLPEDNPGLLSSFVATFKSLITGMSMQYRWAYKTSVWERSYADGAWSAIAFSREFTGDQASLYFVIDYINYNYGAYLSLVNSVLEYERTYGIKKNNIIAPGTCYIDAAEEWYWEVRGSKAYLSAFTDTPYYSTIKVSGTAEYENTKEFAFLISIPCGGSLIEGDKIVVTIGGLNLECTYQVGDITYLPTIAKQNLNFHGGIDGDDLYTFSVKGGLNAFPNYYPDRDNPQQYIHPNLRFLIEDGIIPFQVGDLFEFAVEGGHFIWRKDGGAWSSPLNLSGELQTLDSGLQVLFEFGVSPSYVVNDTWEILAVQENRAENLTTPWEQKTKATGNIVFAFASAVTIDALIVDLHDITGTFKFQASDLADFSVLLHDETITAQSLICKLYRGSEVTPPVPAITAKYFRLLLSGEHEIGHVFLGSMMRLGLDSDGITPLRRFDMKHQTAKRPLSLFEKLRTGFNIKYTSFIYNADWVKMDEMITYLKSNNDMPFYCVANVNYPDSLCVRGKIDMDNIEPGSDIDLNSPEANRLFTITIPVVSE